MQPAIVVSYNLEMTRKFKQIFEVGYGVPLLCLIYEKNEANVELGLSEAHRTFVHLCPGFNSFRNFVLRLVVLQIIELKTSRFKKNKKILVKGSNFVEEMFTTTPDMS